MTKRPAREQPRAVIERDAALARIGRTRRWVLAGAAALTAGAAALVSVLAPGRSFGAKPAQASGVASVSPAAGSARATAPQMPPLAAPGSLGLNAPSQAPGVPSGSSAAPAPAPAPSDPSQSQGNAAQSQVPPQPGPASQPGVVSGGS